MTAKSRRNPRETWQTHRICDILYTVKRIQKEAEKCIQPYHKYIHKEPLNTKQEIQTLNRKPLSLF